MNRQATATIYLTVMGVIDYIFNLSVILGNSSLKAAQKLLRKSAQRGSTNPFLCLLYADQLSGAEKGSVKAKRMFSLIKLAVRHGSKIPHALATAAVLLARNGFADQSQKCAERAMRIAESVEERVTAQFALGVSLLNSGRSEDSVEHFQKALAMDDSHLEAKAGLAAALFNSGNREMGLKLAKGVLAVDADNQIGLGIMSSVEDNDD